MNKYKFGYGVQGIFFFVEPTITEYASNPGTAELNALLNLQAKYPGRNIRYLNLKK